MIEDVFNLGLALANVAITLLDPMLQLANGVDLYREASHTSPLVVSCPPRVQNGSWVCSDRRPLPACFLFCPSGLVPAGESQVDCETYRQDNTTNFSCVPAGVVIIGGLDQQDDAVRRIEAFSQDQLSQDQLTHKEIDLNSYNLASLAENKTLISAATEWYNGKLVTCGGVYQKSCSSLKDQYRQFEVHSVLRSLQEGGSVTVLGPSLQLRGGIGTNARSLTEVYTDPQGWMAEKRISQDAYQSCTARINATHAAVTGGEDNQGWVSLVTADGEVARVNFPEVDTRRWAHGCVAFQGRILIAGGFVNNSLLPTGSTFLLDLASMGVRQVGRMRTPRAAFSRLVVMGGYAWAFGGLVGESNETTGSVERFHLERETWEEAPQHLFVPRAYHTVSPVPENQLWKRFKESNLNLLEPKFESPVVEGLDKNHAIVTMVLIYVPTIYVCMSNLAKSLESGYKGMALRSFSTIIIPFPFIQTLISFVTFKIVPPRYLALIKPSTKEEKLDMEEMKAEVQMAGTFYNSCPSICLQVMIIITFPNRALSWFQISSVAVSSFMTLWTAANLYQLKLGKENEETFLVAAFKKVKTFLITAPLILTSLMFNFSNIILGIINNNFFFVLYMFAAFFSILLPATFSPSASVKKLEKMMGIDEDRAGLFCGVNCRSKDKRRKRVGANIEVPDQIQVPPTDLKGLIKNMFKAFNVAYTNIFCITRPISRDSASIRHFMVGLYPLHFVVNMTSLIFMRFFSNRDVITIRGQIFNYDDVVFAALLTGIANIIFVVFFYYPNFFYLVLRSTAKTAHTCVAKTSALAVKSVTKKKTYKVAEIKVRAEKQVEILPGATFRRHRHFDQSNDESYI